MRQHPLQRPWLAAVLLGGMLLGACRSPAGTTASTTHPARPTPRPFSGTEFPLPTAQSGPTYITSGSDGSLWFTEFAANLIGRITPAGKVTEFAPPTVNSGPVGITSGPDGSLWFTEFTGNQIGRITTEGAITEYALPTANSGPSDITIGPEKQVWFTEKSGNQIGQLTPEAGAFCCPNS